MSGAGWTRTSDWLQQTALWTFAWLSSIVSPEAADAAVRRTEYWDRPNWAFTPFAVAECVRRRFPPLSLSQTPPRRPGFCWPRVT